MHISVPSSLIDQAIQDRRYLHQFPELSGREFQTSKFIRNRLGQLGIDLLHFPSPNVVGFIKGELGHKTIALRADMDALPIQEEGNKSYISQNKGVAHVCGHDAHTAVLLAVSRWLVENPNKFNCNVVLIFQSSEEVAPSGAKMLVDHDVLDNVDSIYGIHFWQDLQKGKIGLAQGPMMASSDEFEITITGKGGHGSMPQDTIDPIYISSHIIQGLQSIISRKIDPRQSAVLSVGKIETGTTFNIIPSTAKISGTIRALTPETRTTIKDNINLILNGICSAFEATGEIKFIPGSPPLINAIEQSQFAKKVIQNTIGKNVFHTMKPVMAGEDFAYYLQKKPGAFAFIGMKGDKSVYPHHHPLFDIDEEVIPLAIEYFINICRSI